MPQSRTPTGPPTILPDLGRFLRETDPGFKDFTEKDDWELGRFLVETEPEFKDVVSYEATAAALTGGDLRHVQLGKRRPVSNADPQANQVIAQEQGRRARTMTPQAITPTPRQEIPPPPAAHPKATLLDRAAISLGEAAQNIPGAIVEGVGRAYGTLGKMAETVAQAPSWNPAAAPLMAVAPGPTPGSHPSLEEAAGQYRQFGRGMETKGRQMVPPGALGVAQHQDYSPAWFAREVPVNLVGTAPLMVAGGVVGVAGRLAGMTVGQGTMLAGVTAGVSESWMEGEDAYQQAIQEGKSSAAAQQAGLETFLMNLPVTVPLGTAIFGGLAKKGALPKFGTAVAGEALQEMYQQAAQDLAARQLPGGKEMLKAGVLGGVTGGLMEPFLGGAIEGPKPGGVLPPNPWSRVLRERMGLPQVDAAETTGTIPGKAPAGTPPIGKDYPPPPTPAAQTNLPYAAQDAPTLFGQPGTVNDQPVLGVDALANAEGAIRAGVAPGTRPAVLPEPTLVKGGLPQPATAAPPPTLVFPPVGDLTTVTPEAAAAHRQATEQALQALPVELQSQARRMIDEGFVPQSVAPDGSIWAVDQRPGREGKVLVFKPDPEPDQGITLKFLSVAERLGLGNLHAALSMLANGENPLETDLAPIQLLNQLGVLAPGETLLQGFSDYVEAIEALLLSNEPSPQSDQAIALLRNWAVGSVPVVDPQLLGQTLPEMAAEVNLLQNTVAALPGERLPGIQDRWKQAIATLTPLPSQDVMIPWEGKKRRKTLAGAKLEEAKAIRANQALSPAEKKDQLRRLMGLHTPAERATRMQEHRAKTKERLQRAAFELQPFGYEHPILRKERETMERAAETDPELNPHLYILRAVAERGGIHDVPEGEEGHHERGWMGEFASGGGRVAGYKVMTRVGSKAERARLKQSRNLRTLESIHHELEQADPYFETMDYSEFERKFIDALSWAANKGMSQRRMPRSRRRGRKGLGITEVGAAPPEVTPAPSPDEPSVEKMRVGPTRKGGQPGQGMIRGGGASERGWRVMTRALYQGDAVEVVPRELSQNAIDEAATAHPDGSGVVTLRVHEGRYGEQAYDPALPERMPYVEVTDNGRGMTLDKVETVFSDLFESGKEAEVEASGGFGVAKAAILMGGVFMRMETVVDEPRGRWGTVRVRHTWEGTPEQVRSDLGAPDRTEVVDASTATGTSVRVYFPSDKAHALKVAVRPVVSSHTLYSRKIGATLQVEHSEWDAGYGHVNDATGEWVEGKEGFKVASSKTVASEDPDRLVPLGQIETPFGRVNFYAATKTTKYWGEDLEDDPRAVRSNVGVVYLNNHRFALKGSSVAAGLTWGETVPNLPGTIVADIEPGDISESDEHYPFTLARDAIKHDLQKAIETWIETEIIKPERDRWALELADAFASVPSRTLHGQVVDVYNTKQRYTDEEIDQLFRDSPTLARLAAVIPKLIHKMGKALHPDQDAKTEKAGVLLAVTNFGGVNVKPKGPERYGIWVNPFTPIALLQEDGKPVTIENVAWGVVHTILHEVTHHKARGGDNAAFTFQFLRNQTRYGNAINEDYATVVSALTGVSRASASALRQPSFLDDADPGAFPTDLLGAFARHAVIIARDGVNDPLVVEENRVERPADDGGREGDLREGVSDVGGAARAGAPVEPGVSAVESPVPGDVGIPPGVTPDRNAPLISPEREAFAKQEISRILQSFISTAGAFNLEKAPTLVKEITVYGANLLARGVRNFPTWAKAMRRQFPYLRRSQIEAVWNALKRAGGVATGAEKILRQPTTPRERAKLPKAKKAEVGLPPPALNVRAIKQGAQVARDAETSLSEFGQLLTDILALVDWTKIVKIAGNTDTRFRVFRQIASQILAYPEFHEVVVQAGLATPEQLARHFERMLTLHGMNLGKLGVETKAHSKVITMLDRAVARGMNLEQMVDGTLIPKGSTFTADEIILPDGRRFDKRTADKANSAYQQFLDDLVDPTRLDANFGGLADAMLHALGSWLAALGTSGTTDPLWDTLNHTYSPEVRMSGLAAFRRHAGGFASGVQGLSVSFMLSQPVTALRNLYVSGIRIPFQMIYAEAIAAAYADVRALVARDQARQQLWWDRAALHKANSREARKILTESPLLRNNPFPRRAWGDQIEEIYNLHQSLKDHPNDISTRRALYLLKGFPKRAADYLQYAMTMEEVDEARLHAPVHRWIRALQFFNRQQEFATRGLVFNATVRAEFRRRGISFSDFMREIEQAQADAQQEIARLKNAPGYDPALMLEAERAASSPLHLKVVDRYFGTEGGLQALDDIMAIAVGRSLDISFASKGIEGGLTSNALKVYNHVLPLRMINPFMRFILNAAGHLYDQTFIALEPMLYWPQFGVAAGLNAAHLKSAIRADRKLAKKEGRPPRDPEDIAAGLSIRRPLGRYAIAVQAQSLAEQLVPDTRRKLEETRLAVAQQMKALAQAKQDLRKAQTAQTKAQYQAIAQTQSFLPMGPPPAIPSTALEAQRVADLTQEVARLKGRINLLRGRLTKLSSRLDHIYEAGISRDTTEVYGKLAMGATMLAIAAALEYALGDDDLEWYEIKLPSLDGKPGWMRVVDLRAFAPYISDMLIVRLAKSFHRDTNWEQFWKDFDRLRQEYDATLPPIPDTTTGRLLALMEAPLHAFTANESAAVEAFRMNYGGKYREPKAMRDIWDAFIGISKQAGTQSVVADIFFGGRPPEGGSRVTHALIGLAASFASRFTMPFKTITDIQMVFDEEARVRRTAPRQPLETPGGWTAPFWQVLENIPGVRESIPESINPLTGKRRMVETPLLRQVTGFTIKEIEPIEREFRRLGLTPQEYGFRKTDIPWVDNQIASRYAEILKEWIPQVQSMPEYQDLAPNEQRQLLTGTTTKDPTTGASINFPGILPKLKRGAILRAVDDLGAVEERNKARATPRQAADFERWGRALMGLPEWEAMRHPAPPPKPTTPAVGTPPPEIY